MRSHVQHGFAGENISVKPHRQRDGPSEQNRNDFHQSDEKKQQRNQGIHKFIDLHFHAKNVLGETHHAIVANRPKKAHHQKNRGHRHSQVRVGSRRAEQRTAHVLDGERHHAVLVGRPEPDAADTRNQIHIIAQDDENQKRRRKRKTPARNLGIQNIGHETLPAFANHFHQVLHPRRNFLDVFPSRNAHDEQNDRRHNPRADNRIGNRKRDLLRPPPRKNRRHAFFQRRPDIKKRRRFFGRKHFRIRRFSGLRHH